MVTIKYEHKIIIKMSSKRSSNKNINEINEPINHLTLNLNPSETNNNKNPLIVNY